MGITDFFSDVWDTFSHPSPDAEAPPKGGTSTDTPASGTDEQSSEEADVNKQDAKSGGDGEVGHKPSGGDDEEEEEEEETVDPKEQFEEGKCIVQGSIWLSSCSGKIYAGKLTVLMTLDAQLALVI